MVRTTKMRTQLSIGTIHNPSNIYSWGQQIEYKSDSKEKSLSHMIIDTFEFIILSCFSRILGDDEGSEISLKGLDTSYKIQQAGSTVNTTQTELLLASCLEIVFEQLQKYTKIMSKVNTRKRTIKAVKRSSGRDQQSEVQRLTQALEIVFRNQGEDPDEERDHFEAIIDSARNDPNLRRQVLADAGMDDDANGSHTSEGEDNKEAEAQEEDHKEPQSEENKSANSQDQPIDYVKAVKMYDKSVVLKLLRLLEIFTAIAVKSKGINHFVAQVANPKLISTLMELSVMCQEIQHSMVVMKILSNLITLGIAHDVINETFAQIKNSSWGKPIFTVNTKADFENNFLQYCYNSLVEVRSKQWQKEQKNYGAFTTSKSIVKIFSNVMRSETQSDWKTNIEKVIDAFMSKINEYPIVKCEALLGVLEGGEYQGLGYGVHGITKDNSKFTAVGFFKDIESSQKEYKMSNEFETTSDKLLAIYYDERHPERNDMFLATPEEVTLIPTLSNKFSNFLMNSVRLNQFISALQLDQTPDFNNTEMVAKR